MLLHGKNKNSGLRTHAFPYSQMSDGQQKGEEKTGKNEEERKKRKEHREGLIKRRRARLREKRTKKNDEDIRIDTFRDSMDGKVDK